MKYSIITEPTALVVPLAEIKSYLRIIADFHNDQLLALSKAAEDYFERETRRYLITRTIEAYFDDFDCITIQHRPNVQVLSVEYYDADNARQELSAGDYTVDDKGLDTTISFSNTATLGTHPNPVVVTYSVGYGAEDEYGSVTDVPVPELIKYAIKGLVTHWFLQPAPVATGTIVSELPLHVRSIIDQFKVVEV